MNAEVLQHLAEKVGTPFWIGDAALLRQRIAAIKLLTEGVGLQARYAMKACPATRILKEMLEAGIWIDAVSGNEVLRAKRAGFPGSSILYTSDVFRDGAIAILREHGVMPNLGSPGMLRELQTAGYAGPISLRVNPGFGHGHVNACDTGGPSSKHGIWFSDICDVAIRAERFGMSVTMLHAHIGSGPKFPELLDNMRRLAKQFAESSRSSRSLRPSASAAGFRTIIAMRTISLRWNRSGRCWRTRAPVFAALRNVTCGWKSSRVVISSRP